MVINGKVEKVVPGEFKVNKDGSKAPYIVKKVPPKKPKFD